MLTTMMLREDELSALSPLQVLGVEYLLHERLSDLARRRRTGDDSLLLAIRAVHYLDPILAQLGEDGTETMLEALRDSAPGRAALERATEAAALAELSCAA